MMEITKDLKVGIVGVGKVGMSIVQAFAQSGFKIQGMDIDQGNIDRGLKRVGQNLESLVSKGKMKISDNSSLPTTHFALPALVTSHFSHFKIEAVFENMD